MNYWKMLLIISLMFGLLWYFIINSEVFFRFGKALATQERKSCSNDRSSVTPNRITFSNE
jgi:hypothetical protein